MDFETCRLSLHEVDIALLRACSLLHSGTVDGCYNYYFFMPHSTKGNQIMKIYHHHFILSSHQLNLVRSTIYKSSCNFDKGK